MSVRLKMVCSACPGKSAGFSLIEMMVASVLGLLMVAAVGAVYMGSRATYRTQEGLGQVQESGRYLSYVFYPYVRLAGFLPDPLSQIDPADHFRGSWRQIFGSDDGFFSVDDVTGVASVQAGTDALIVSFGGNTDSVRTCRGQNVAANQMAANVFYISTADSKGVRSLMCGTQISTSGTGAALLSPTVAIAIAQPEPIIYGVQDMQILYGVDTDQTDDNPPPPALPGYIPNTYFEADQIPDVDGDGVADWQRVVSVQIDLTTVGDEATEGAAVGAATAGDITDDFVDDAHRVQRVFSTTISLRNRLRS